MSSDAIEIDVEALTDDIQVDVSSVYGPQSGTGLSDEVKQALLACFAHVAWTDEHGQDYYDALENALYPPADLVSISAVYTQSGTVYDTDTLDSLKTDLVVTAVYSDSTTEAVTTYTLSGTLTVGTSTITVSYGGKTATFTVTVTHVAQNTTAEVVVENKVQIHITGDPYYMEQAKTNGGITKIYQMDAPTTTLYPAGIIPTKDSVIVKSGGCLYVHDENGDPINFVNENTANSGSYNRWAQNAEGTMTEFSNSWTVEQYYGISFSVDIRYLDDAYMYDKTTGQVWFAGVNTPYYGMSNISEAGGE